MAFPTPFILLTRSELPGNESRIYININLTQRVAVSSKSLVPEGERKISETLDIYCTVMAGFPVRIIEFSPHGIS
jgi:hypothetical protein